MSEEEKQLYKSLANELSGWNTRIIKHAVTQKFNNELQYDETYYAIHEVYYDKENKPIMWSENPIDLTFEDKEGFEIVLKQILEAKDRTILEFENEKLIDTNIKL